MDRKSRDDLYMNTEILNNKSTRLQFSSVEANQIKSRPISKTIMNNSLNQTNPMRHSTQNSNRNSNVASKRVSRPREPPPKPQRPPVPNLPRVICLYNYDPQDLDELSFREGDIIDILKERK